MSKIPPKFRNYVAKPIRPIAEYPSVAWSQRTPKDISAIESIQRRAAHFANDYYLRESSVSVMLAPSELAIARETSYHQSFDDVLYIRYLRSIPIFFPAEIRLSRFSRV